jgi:hypothetical protein
MTFTYDLASVDASILLISKVRLELGDTVANAGVRPDGSNLTDEEITVWLTDEGNDLSQTVARAAAALANVWTNVANITVGPRKEELGSIAKAWADRASEAGPAAGANYAVKVFRVDHIQDPYRVRPEDESGL